MLAIIRWIITAVFALLWLWIAGFNARIAWKEWVRKKQGGSSPVGLAGIIIALIVFAICPLGTWHDRRPYIWIPLVLDYGSLPYVATGAVYFILDICKPEWRGNMRKRTEGLEREQQQ